MNLNNTKFEGLFTFSPPIIKDNRGYFCENYRIESFVKLLNYKVSFCQENESKSLKNVFRGLHYQIPPFAQSKLVKVNYGKIIDFVLDIRINSKTFGKYFKIELSHLNRKQIFVPRGFAHGFLVLSQFAIVNYKVDNYYSQKHDRSINVMDEEINIKEINDSILISKKDLNSPKMNDADLFDNKINYYL